MNVWKAWLYVADPLFTSKGEGTDCNLIVDVRQEFALWRWCQSPGIYWQFTIQFPSFIFWTARVIWLSRVITTPTTHTHVFQMFPKRMNSREAPRSPVLDSTKSWKPTSWNHRAASSLLTPPRHGPIFMIYLPRMCQASREYKRADIPIVAFRFPWKDAIQGRNKSSVPTQNRNQMSENTDKMCSSTFVCVAVCFFLLQCRSGKHNFSFSVGSKLLLNFLTGLLFCHRWLIPLLKVSVLY